GAVRRTVFEEIGGFDQERFRYSSVEDIEFGYRLHRAGFPILLDKSLQGTHLKRWTMLSCIKTDIVRRAIPWSWLILETKMLPNDLNLRRDQRASFALVASGCALLALSLFHTKAIAIAATAFVSVLIMNRRMYVFFFRQRGFSFALSCIPLH